VVKEYRRGTQGDLSWGPAQCADEWRERAGTARRDPMCPGSPASRFLAGQAGLAGERYRLQVGDCPPLMRLPHSNGPFFSFPLFFCFPSQPLYFLSFLLPAHPPPPCEITPVEHYGGEGMQLNLKRMFCGALATFFFK
jgi:hypothetical protein